MTVSLNQIVHSRRRFLAWLGICAILMLFIAPVVSNTLVAQGVPMPMMGDMSSMNDMSSSMPMASMDGMNNMSSMSLSSMSSSSSDKPHSASAEHQHQNLSSSQKTLPIQQADTMSPSDMMGATCGYCVLLMHLPLLVLLAVVIISTLVAVIRPAYSRLICCLLVSPILTDSQPRAPPLSAGFALRTAA